LHKETGLFIERLPEWIDVLRLHIIPRLQLWLGSDFQMDSGAVKGALITHWQSAEGVAAKVLPWLGTSGGVLITMFINLLLIPLAMFYFLRDWNNLLSKIDQLIPRHCYCKVKEITLEVDTVLAEFLRGQISVMFLMSLYYVTLLWCVGLEFALPIGIVAGVLVFIPYIGMMTGLTLATLAASMQFTSLSNVMIVWAVFGAGQLIEGMFVTPRLVGERVGLHPLVVIFSLLAFGQLFGFFGVLLALPLAAIVLVTLRHVRTWYFTSTMYIRK
jgi:predicted PurR-regulated permease PerM